MLPQLHSGKFALARPLKTGQALQKLTVRHPVSISVQGEVSTFHLVLSIEDLPIMRQIYDVRTLERCEGACAIPLSPAYMRGKRPSATLTADLITWAEPTSEPRFAPALTQ